MKKGTKVIRISTGSKGVILGDSPNNNWSIRVQFEDREKPMDIYIWMVEEVKQ
jgi:hypothetical protein